MADEQFYISSTKYTPPDLSADRTERLVASERLDFDEAEITSFFTARRDSEKPRLATSSPPK